MIDLIEMAKNNHSKKFLTCVHEAGHAILCLHQGKHFDYIEILDSEHGQVVGIDPNLTPLSRAKIILAGPTAENLFTGKNISMQWQSINDLNQLKGVDTRFLKVETERILRKNWDEVINLANRLMKTNRIYYSQIFASDDNT